MGIIIVLIHVYLAQAYRDYYKPLFIRRSPVV